MMRWECKLKIPTEHIWLMFRDIELRMKWEQVMEKYELIQKDIVEGQDVIYYSVKTPFGTKNRDFVCVRGKTENFEGYDYVGFMTSTTHETKPETRSYVRGEVIIGASFFKKNDDGTTDCLVFAQNDPKVSLNIQLSYISN